MTKKKNTKKYSINLGKGKKGRIEEQEIDGRDSKQILFEYKNENLIKGLDGLNNTPLHISGER